MTKFHVVTCLLGAAVALVFPRYGWRGVAALLTTFSLYCVITIIRQACRPLRGEKRAATSGSAFTPLPTEAHDAGANHKVGFSSKRLAAVQAAAKDGVIDAIVIGSGIGGLTTAALLAEEGQVVLVLEQHDVAGGCTHSFVDRGFEFDTGLHYVGGEIWRPGHSGSRLLLDATTAHCKHGGVEWTRMDPNVDIALQPPLASEVAKLKRGTTPREGPAQKEAPWRRWPMPSGKAALRAALIASFPAEARAIDRYFAAVASQQAAAGLFFAHKAIAGWLPTCCKLNKLIAGCMGCRHFAISDRTVSEVLASLTTNAELISVLTYHWGNYGLPPSEASFAMHAMVANHYFEGGAYPTGGSAEIARRMIPTITMNGGAVLVRCRVAHIAVSNVGGTVVGVQLTAKHGSVLIRAKNVISAAGAAATFGPLLQKAVEVDPHGIVATALATPRAALADPTLWGKTSVRSFTSDAANLKRLSLKKGGGRNGSGSGIGTHQMSAAHVMLFVALNGDRATLRLPASNLWFATGGRDHDAAAETYDAAAYVAARANDADVTSPMSSAASGMHAPAAPFSSVFLSFPSTKDSDWERRWPGKSTAHIIAAVPHALFAKWRDAKLKKRGAEYDALKAELSAQLLVPMFREFPHLRKCVEFHELGTPLSTAHYIGQAFGESYGLAHTPARFRQAWLTPSVAGVQNLYLSGTDVLSAGVMGAQVGGFLAACAVCPRVAWTNLRVLTKL